MVCVPHVVRGDVLEDVIYRLVGGGGICSIYRTSTCDPQTYDAQRKEDDAEGFRWVKAQKNSLSLYSILQRKLSPLMDLMNPQWSGLGATHPLLARARNAPFIHYHKEDI